MHVDCTIVFVCSHASPRSSNATIMLSTTLSGMRGAGALSWTGSGRLFFRSTATARAFSEFAIHVWHLSLYFSHSSIKGIMCAHLFGFLATMRRYISDAVLNCLAASDHLPCVIFIPALVHSCVASFHIFCILVFYSVLE